MATLKGKTILIIGGSGGIGYGVVLASLQSHAAKVIIGSSSQDRLAETVKRLKEEEDIASGLVKGEIETKVINCKDLDSVKAAVESVGEIDHLVFVSGDELRITDFKSAEVESMKGLLSHFKTSLLRLTMIQRPSMLDIGPLYKLLRARR